MNFTILAQYFIQIISDGIFGYRIDKTQLQVDLNPGRATFFTALRWLRENLVVNELKLALDSDFMVNPYIVMNNGDRDARIAEWSRRIKRYDANVNKNRPKSISRRYFYSRFLHGIIADLQCSHILFDCMRRNAICHQFFIVSKSTSLVTLTIILKATIFANKLLPRRSIANFVIGTRIIFLKSGETEPN